MDHPAVPVMYPLFLWWFSTGIVMYIVGLPARTFRWSILAAGGLLVGSLYGLAATRGDATVSGVYLAFTYALLVWGAQEILFLTGFITGPRPKPCPKNCVGWQRFSFAVQAILYHELALLASGLAIVAVTWGGANRVGAFTFLILWAMRLSSKINLFLGVQSLNLEFLPKHLAFIGSFFARKTMNALFPVSVTVSTAVVALLMARAWRSDAAAHEMIGFTLLGILLALAVLEHWFMVLPLPAVALWSWGLRSREAEAAKPEVSARERLEERFRRARYEHKEPPVATPAVESGHPTSVQTVNARFP